MTTVAFLILNYQTYEDTCNCVRSIRNMKQNNIKVEIVIVDNASTDNCQEQLKKHFVGEKDIHFVYSNENLGFSGGNNLGYSYIKKCINPDFVVMTNSDIDFRQTEFLEELVQIAEQTHFSVLGPDIYAYRLGIHQNPVKEKLPSLEVQKVELEEQIAYYKWLTELETQGETQFPISKGKAFMDWLNRMHMTTFLQRIYLSLPIANNRLTYKRQYENVMLHGSCIIFSKLYLDKYQKVLDPEPFFYGEEDLLLIKCLRGRDKMVYSPKLKVWHLADASVNGSKGVGNLIAKEKFRYENYIKTKKLCIAVMENEHYFDHEGV